MKNNQLEAKKKEEFKTYKVGDHIYFEDFQDKYYNELFYEEIEEAVWQMSLCEAFFARFEPTSQIDTLDEDKKNKIFSLMVEEFKSLPCPPSKMIIDDTGIRCMWFLPNLIHEDWFDSKENISIFCYKIRNQFNNLESCIMKKQFASWVDDGSIFTPEEYMKSVFRLNQFINVLGLKITLEDN
ncbi:hypothetical protein [Sediminibacillus halophilus]|uniref:Uncharacterized protein n=1 Tax=Sediminibacillus halophilus TaxID=482461 RepID=A0A1G9T4M5_9BACI|nr:hypothetical protein [Sediminibacillus halophilus]SDM42641.1 hypothetical protein SAMN05216244_2434 [Sediminibacillus halophilus]